MQGSLCGCYNLRISLLRIGRDTWAPLGAQCTSLEDSGLNYIRRQVDLGIFFRQGVLVPWISTGFRRQELLGNVPGLCSRAWLLHATWFTLKLEMFSVRSRKVYSKGKMLGFPRGGYA